MQKQKKLTNKQMRLRMDQTRGPLRHSVKPTVFVTFEWDATHTQCVGGKQCVTPNLSKRYNSLLYFDLNIVFFFCSFSRNCKISTENYSLVPYRTVQLMYTPLIKTVFLAMHVKDFLCQQMKIWCVIFLNISNIKSKILFLQHCIFIMNLHIAFGVVWHLITSKQGN